MFDLKEYIALKQDIVDKALIDILDEDVSMKNTRIKKAMAYSIMAGGKRLRPILCIAAFEALSKKNNFDNFKLCLRTACSLEMIHTYSLIHDDLPAMDDDKLRRGKKTCHIEFDEATAIMAGDALLTLAFKTLSLECKSDLALKMLKIINIISKASGYQGMIQGQMLDMASEGRTISLQELEDMHLLKTGALIEASVLSGVVLSDADEKTINSFKGYAKNIGLAFQVTDDILNIEGDPAVMGKSIGTDESRNKATYPGLLGIDKSKEYAKELIEKSLNILNLFDDKLEPLKAIANYIIERNY